MRCALVLVTLLLPAAGCAGFRPLDPVDLVNAVSFSPSVGDLPEHERLVFTATWKGVPAGEGSFTFRRNGDVYESEATVKTIGLAALLYGVTVKASAISGTRDLLSRSWSYETVGGRKPKRVQVRFHRESGRVLSVIRKGDKVEKIDFEAKGMLDPLSTIHALRRSDLTRRRSYRTDLFTERNTYRAESVVMGPERVVVPAGEYDAVLIRTEIRKMVDGVPKAEGRAAEFWITDDENRVPVRIDAETKFGRISLKLTEYERDGQRVGEGN